MDKSSLSLLNFGDSLDSIANLDPRGYGVCRVLYKAARDMANEPLSIKGAKLIIDSLAPKGLVYIISGFVLPDCEKAETDGLIGAVLLSKVLALYFRAKPVIICPPEALSAAEAASRAIGLEVISSIPDASDRPYLSLMPFTKDKAKALDETAALLENGMPCLVISIEAPGSNAEGEYHSAKGINITELEAKSDALFRLLQNMGVPSLSIGDLGNEIGLSTLRESVLKYIDKAGKSCQCGCVSGIFSDTAADAVITATASDWGVYALISAIALLRGNKEIIPSGDELKDALRAGVENGLVDMSGKAVPAIDGFNESLNAAVLSLMRELVSHAIDNRGEYEYWFDSVLQSGYFN
ncbi:MAG: DUF4392 domain-containing protein [Clostridiales bacterium]|jgi:hypothetical protein|nr:DUF4392 domain-containing protein [Clostridiales bacterium]HOA33203.1 DUF4392 domain-containing protein [Clostridiales bacterium]HQA05533.1 DUF4392 domain-containing protein [Clostridiales bacterium]HQD71834.1 DUF4392 domain-containing protein [Clostridiales bacterium]